MFIYLGRMLDRLCNDWTAVLNNIWKARQVCGWIEKLLRMERGGGAGSHGKVLLHGSSGVTIIWDREMGAFGTNVTDIRGSACVFTEAGNKV